MVSVAERVWDYWRDLEERLAEPAVVMLFSSDVSTREALQALRRAVSGAIAKLQSEGPLLAGEDELRTGYCALAAVPGGVALRIDEEPSDFELLVRYIVEGLDALGVDGRFDLYEPGEPLAIPDTVDLLECRLRVNGQRYHVRYRNHKWRADWTALWATVETALAWCLENGANVPLSLVVGLFPPVRLGPEDDVRAYMRDALEQTADLGVAHLTSAAPDRFRTIAIGASRGRVTLIEGGVTITEQGWQPSLQRLRELMTATSEHLVYGLIKRGSRRSKAQLATSLAQDWPPVPHFNARAIGAEAFEDEYAPDAFGVQLLGPGYAGRLPEGSDWRISTGESGRVLVEHVDQAAWYEQPFPSAGPRGSSEPTVPDVLQRARRDFAPVLFNDDIPGTDEG